MEDLSPKKTAKNQYRTWRRWLDARRWDFSTISGTRAVRICCTIVSMLQSDRILRSVRFWDWDFLITCKHMTDGLDKDLSPSCPKGRPPVRQWNIRIPTAQTSVRASTWGERKHCKRKGCTSLNIVSQNAKQRMMNNLWQTNGQEPQSLDVSAPARSTLACRFCLSATYCPAVEVKRKSKETIWMHGWACMETWHDILRQDDL